MGKNLWKFGLAGGALLVAGSIAAAVFRDRNASYDFDDEIDEDEDLFDDEEDIGEDFEDDAIEEMLKEDTTAAD